MTITIPKGITFYKKFLNKAEAHQSCQGVARVL